MQRPCIACGQFDDHPRHQVAVSADAEVFFHLDCHVLASGCELCKKALANGGEGKTGDELRAHLTSAPPAQEEVSA